MKLFRKKDQTPYPPHVRLDSEKADVGFAEAFRTLRTGIHFLLLEKNIRSLVVTSAGPGEGKTVTAANLAYTLSRAGKSVVVIDADLRKNNLTHFHQARNGSGLTGLLSEMLTAEVRSGVLEEFTVTDLVTLHRLRRSSGVLNVGDGRHELSLRFRKGEMVLLDWRTRPEENRLANVLVRNGVLSREKVETALRQRENTGRPLGFVLASLGLASPETLKGVLTLHTLEAIQILLRMESGKFFFADRPERPGVEATPDLVDMDRLFDEAAREEHTHRFLRKKVDEAIIHPESGGYALIPSGQLPQNPSEVLGSRQMAFLISYLTDRFDVVIFDTAPVMATSDAVLLGGQSDGTVLVVKAGHIKRGAVRKSVEQLQAARANVLGVILNRVDIRKSAYYAYYRQYYASYYAESARRG